MISAAVCRQVARRDGPDHRRGCDGSVPHCGACRLVLRGQHWVWQAVRQVCWRCDWVLVPRQGEVAAAGVEQPGGQRVSVEAVGAQRFVVARPAVGARPASGGLPAGVPQLSGPQVVLEQLVLPVVSAEMQWHVWAQRALPAASQRSAEAAPALPARWCQSRRPSSLKGLPSPGLAWRALQPGEGLHRCSATCGSCLLRPR